MPTTNQVVDDGNMSGKLAAEAMTLQELAEANLKINAEKEQKIYEL